MICQWIAGLLSIQSPNHSHNLLKGFQDQIIQALFSQVIAANNRLNM